MIEDDAELASILTNQLSQYNINIYNFETPELGISALNLKKYDLIITTTTQKNFTEKLDVWYLEYKDFLEE